MEGGLALFVADMTWRVSAFVDIPVSSRPFADLTKLLVAPKTNIMRCVTFAIILLLTILLAALSCSQDVMSSLFVLWRGNL